MQQAKICHHGFGVLPEWQSMLERCLSTPTESKGGGFWSKVGSGIAAPFKWIWHGITWPFRKLFGSRSEAPSSTTNATGNTNGKTRVKRDTQKPPEHPLKSVNEQIKTVTGAVNNFQKSVLTSLKDFFTYLTDTAKLSFLESSHIHLVLSHLHSSPQHNKPRFPWCCCSLLLPPLSALPVTLAGHICHRFLPSTVLPSTVLPQ
ncbi:WiSP family protein [Tropheryma whipplei TW08/27]|nr:WiSP family protein [Tropheryma whipplei TW08/27]